MAAKTSYGMSGQQRMLQWKEKDCRCPVHASHTGCEIDKTSPCDKDANGRCGPSKITQAAYRPVIQKENP